MRDRNHERILLGKEVYCKYKKKGCKWQGKLKEFDGHCLTILKCKWCRNRLQCYEQEQHEQVCMVAVEVIACELKPFGCRQKLPRMSMSQHMQDSCNEHVKLLKQANEQSSSEVNCLANKVNLLEENQVDREKKYQILRTAFNQMKTEVNNLRNEKAQILRVQYKYAIDLSIILGLLIGIFLQYLYPVIFVTLVLPAIVLSILILGICVCYDIVYLGIKW